MSGGASFQQHAKRRRAPAGPQRLTLSVQDADDAAAAVVPPVTVVLDGRCICHRVHLNRHTGYRSSAGRAPCQVVIQSKCVAHVHYRNLRLCRVFLRLRRVLQTLGKAIDSGSGTVSASKFQPPRAVINHVLCGSA